MQHPIPPSKHHDDIIFGKKQLETSLKEPQATLVNALSVYIARPTWHMDGNSTISIRQNNSYTSV